MFRRGSRRAGLDALRLAYEELCKVHERPRIVVKTYFDHVGDAYGVFRDLPIEGVGLDFTGRVHGTELGPDVHEHGGRHNAEFVAELAGSTINGCSPGSSTGATSGAITSSIPSTPWRGCATMSTGWPARSPPSRRPR